MDSYLEELCSRESYSLQIITRWLREHDLKYVHCSSKTGGFNIIQTGVRAKLDLKYTLSIQTNPMVCADYFAETALMTRNGVAYVSSLGYGDVYRHPDPENLFNHLEELIGKLALIEHDPSEFDDKFDEQYLKSQGKGKSTKSDTAKSDKQELESSDSDLGLIGVLRANLDDCRKSLEALKADRFSIFQGDGENTADDDATLPALSGDDKFDEQYLKSQGKGKSTKSDTAKSDKQDLEDSDSEDEEIDRLSEMASRLKSVQKRF